MLYNWIFKRLDFCLILFDPFGCLPIMVEVACFFFVIKNWNAQKRWKFETNECFNIFFPSPADVSSISWGWSTVVHWGWVCGSDSATPPTFSCSKHFCTATAKKQKKKRKKNRPRPKRPKKENGKNPQNARKNLQTPANPENRVFGSFLHTVASFVVVFARHRDLKKGKSNSIGVRNRTHVNKREVPGFKVEPMEGQTHRLCFLHIVGFLSSSYLFFVKGLASEETTK